MAPVKIGVYIRLLGRQGRDGSPTWQSIATAARAAEAAGLDLIALEDGLLYETPDGQVGVWEAVSVAAAVAAVTSSIGIAHAVLNSPYRYPGRVAAIANTLDEISGGRYTLGIGAGNTPDDYPRFGIDADPRYSRFEEAIQIIHGLLKQGRYSYSGTYYRVDAAALPLRGPSPVGPRISIAAGKPKMIRLAARYADEWNWWVDPSEVEVARALAAEVDVACAEVGREPATLRRSLDLFSIGSGGRPAATADKLRLFGDAGFDLLRCDLKPGDGAGQLDAIAWLGEVAQLL